jgi:hypothetical protein
MGKLNVADLNCLCQHTSHSSHVFLPTQKFTYENWIWAFTMLFSRAIRLRSLKEGETLALVPYADLINHSPFSQAYIDARETGDWLFSTGDEEIILYADRSYKKMEQVCAELLSL